jgi:3-deoxy-7-phosphoheptulonate synthase
LAELVNQVRASDYSIMGMMIESFIGPGNQPLKSDPSTLQYGVSVTDPCIDWPTTERCLIGAAEGLEGIAEAAAHGK